MLTKRHLIPVLIAGGFSFAQGNVIDQEETAQQDLSKDNQFAVQLTDNSAGVQDIPDWFADLTTLNAFTTGKGFPVASLYLGASLTSLLGCEPLGGEASISASLDCLPVIQENTTPLVPEILPSQEKEWSDTLFSTGQPLWGEIFPWGTPVTFRFNELARLTLGESIWTTLDVGTGVNNDYVQSSQRIEQSDLGLNIDISARNNERPIFAYLDADGAGLGACTAPDDKNDTQADVSYPGKAINRCLEANEGDVGEFDTLHFRTSKDVWIKQIGFKANPAKDKNLFGASINIEDYRYIFEHDQEDDEIYFWTPPTPYFLAANTTFVVGQIDRDFFVTRMDLHEATRRVAAPLLLSPLTTPQILATIPEPSSVVLLAIGLLGLCVVLRRQLIFPLVRMFRD